MKLSVYLNMNDKRQFVGLLAEEGRRIFFEYSIEFLKSGIELSPFKLPLKAGVFEDKEHTFNGLFGLFNDSLPDGWGCLLIDKFLKQSGLSYASISPLTRLSYAGKISMGALEYEPVQDENFYENPHIDLDEFSKEIENILDDMPTTKLDDLIHLQGSAGGARPKILVNISKDKKKITSDFLQENNNSEAWIIKFFSKEDNKNLGLEEFVYSIMAKDAGIEMPETYLFPSSYCKGYFGVKRFDRIGKNKIHVHTVCGLLHASHLYSSISYEDLLKTTAILTRNKIDVLKVFKLMIFNILSKNQDDHTKNFSFMLDNEYNWKFAPAYDLTPSVGINHEQMLTINGKGKNINLQDFIIVGEKFDIKAQVTKEIFDEINTSLEKYPLLIKEYS